MNNPKILIACKIFYDELLKTLPPELDVKIIWIEAAMHADNRLMEAALKGALAEAAATGLKTHLFVGFGCHPDLPDLAKEYDADILPVKNCLEVFLGPRKEELEQGGTMLLTPGWVRAWPSIMAALGWDEVDVRMNYGRYQRILVLEPGIRPLTDEEILLFFDLILVPIDIEPLPLDHFQGLLNDLLT